MGHGSRFTFSLPISAQERRTQSNPPAARRRPEIEPPDEEDEEIGTPIADETRAGGAEK